MKLPYTHSTREIMAIRYLVEEIPLTGNHTPFRFPVPNDCKAITGVLVLTDALVNIGAGQNLIAAAGFSLKPYVKEFETRLERNGILGTSIPVPDGDGGSKNVPLSKFSLGTINLVSRESSRNFYNQTVSPERFRVHLKKSSTVLFSADLSINSFKSKQHLFMPVYVEGITGELSGIYKPSSFAAAENLVTADQLAGLTLAGRITKLCQSNFLNAGLIKVVLRYTTAD